MRRKFEGALRELGGKGEGVLNDYELHLTYARRWGLNEYRQLLMEEVLDAGKSDGERGFAQRGVEFFQLMRGASLDEAEMGLRMVRGRGGREGDFSVREGLAEVEMGGVRACVDTLGAGDGDGVLRDTAWGKDIVVPRGRSGKKGYGLEHIQEKRILHGFRPDEAAFIAVCAMKAAQSVKKPHKQKSSLCFNRFGVTAVVSDNKNEQSRNRLLTGFVFGTEGGNKAVDSVAAELAQHFYALDELSRIQEVGAALNSALARFEGIIKDNPHDWENVVEWEIEKLKVKQNAKANGTFMKAPNGADTNLTESQWLSVRTGAFKNWFGDWEKVARLSFDSNTVSIAQAEKHLRSLKGREISNEETGISVSINSNQRRELLNASKARRSHENGFAYHGHYAVVSSYR